MESDGKMKPPKFCILCKRTSYLQCQGCETSYCSSDCQREDFNNHHIRHRAEQSHRDFDMEPVKRASKACEMDIDDVTKQVERIDLSTHPMTSDLVEIHNFFDRPIACINKFCRPMLIPKNIKDDSGYFPVMVTSIEIVDIETNVDLVYSVILAILKDDLTLYKTLLNMTYESLKEVLLSSANDYSTYSKSLMMLKIGGQWTRCIQKMKIDSGSIILEDIDTGKKHRFNESFSFKAPQKQELARNAFAFKVKLINIYDRFAVDVGDFVKIRITNSNLRGVSDAEIECDNKEPEPMEEMDFEVKPQSTQVFDVSRVESQNDKKELQEDVKIFTPKMPEKAAEPEEDRIFIKEIKVKHFPTGKQTLTFMDGSKIDKGKLHVCIATENHYCFHEDLFYNIQDYVDKNEDLNNYKPVPGELVLVEYHCDDRVYRAVTIMVSDIDCRVAFIDYGTSDSIVPFERVWKLPKQFIEPCVSRTVSIKLKSGKELTGIDAGSTLDKLEKLVEFEGDVECLGGNKYAVTIDDNLLVYK